MNDKEDDDILIDELISICMKEVAKLSAEIIRLSEAYKAGYRTVGQLDGTADCMKNVVRLEDRRNR